ncbi:MAG: ribbon-helix-helix protein, CopG family [Acidobacteria bacterium]|nr:ribbon-helix-helix protein, CopG family [Acidobacteriota bacterium]
MDEKLLAKLDADEETQRDGRSAVLRRAAADYLRRRRRHAIADTYRKAYSKHSGLGDEFDHWEDEGTWPDQ